MGKAMNWNRAKPPKPTDDAIGAGMVRKDGMVTRGGPQDALARRAARAQAAWMRQNGLVVDKRGRIVKG